MAIVSWLLLVFLQQTLFLPVGAWVKVSAPVHLSLELGSPATVPCTYQLAASPVEMKYLAILWNFKGTEIAKFDSKGFKKPSDPRLTLKADHISKGEVSLYINNVTLSDIGPYTCRVIYSPDQDYKLVGVTVYARPTIKPLEKQEGTDGIEEMVCSVTGFYPRTIAVTLLRNGKVANESVLSQIQTSSDGTYSINRTLTLQPNEKLNSLSCEVQHESLPDILKKEVNLLYEGENNNQSLIIGLVVAGIIVAVFVAGFVVYTQKRKKGLLQFMVGDIQGPQTWIDGEKITLYCTGSNCTPNTEVKWTVQDKDGNSVTISDIVTKDTEEEQPLMSAEYLINSEKKDKPGKKVCDFTSSLSFIPSLSRHLKSAVTCEFTCAEKTEQKSFKYKTIYAKPQFIEPAEFTICNTEEVQLCINLRKFCPRDIDISLSCDHRQLPDIKNPECTMNSDGTYNTVFRQAIPADWFIDLNCKVCVTWKHVSMESPECREFSVKDLPWHPEIEDINIQKSTSSSNIELHCKIYNFFPDLLTVIWFDKKKGKNVTDSDKYKISETRERDANLTFSCNTSLCFEKSLITEEEVEFICRVEHPCLKNPIQSSTGLLQVTDLQNFIVNNIQGPQSWIFGEKVTLYCAASYCKEDTLVTWILREDNGPTHEVSELLSERDSKHGMLQSADYMALRERTETSDREGLQDITSSLSFRPSISKHKNMVTICRLSCGGKTKEKTFQPKNLYVKPKASDSIKLSLLDSGEVLGSFNIQEFYPNDIQITWTGGRQSAYDKLESSENFTDKDSTHNVLSECEIDGRLFKNPDFTVKVSWKHGSMDGWESRQVSVSDKDYPWRPDIQDIILPSMINNRPANLVCRISSFFPDNVAVKWLRKEKDSEERFPLTHSEKYKISDLSLKKQSGNTFECRACLNFTPSVKIEQGAEFVCVVEHPSLASTIERKTGAIQVKGFPDVKDIINSGDRIFSLNVDGFYPQTITMYWKLVPVSSTGDSYTVTSSSSFNENQDGSFTVTSICDLKKNEFCEDNNYILTATVEHEALEDPISRSISVERQEAKATAALIQDQNLTKSADLREPSEVDAGPVNQQTEDYQKFIMNDIQGHPIWTHGEKVILYCTASNCSENANVFWIIKENDGTLHEMCDTSTQKLEKPEYVAFRDSTEETDKEGFYNITSSLTLIPSVLKHSEVIIKCRIDCEGKKKEKTFKLQSINAKPTVSEPVTVSLCESGEIMYSLNLQNFYPKEIKIIWTYGPGQSQKPVTSNDVIKTNPDLTYSIQSELKVPGDNFKDPNFIVCVSWEHSSLEHPEHRKFCAKDPEFTWRPEIQKIPISRVLLGKRVNLQYNISNYYPDALAVRWFKKEKGSNELIHLRSGTKYKMPHRLTHNRQLDNTYSCTACLDVHSSLSSEQGAQFICRVEHPSLERPIERHTEPLLLTAKPTVSEPVTVSLCESGEIMYSLNLQNFYPKEIKIIWTYGPGQSQKPATSNDVIKTNPDLTYSIQSELKVPGENFKDPNFIVCVSWEHSSLDDPEHRKLCAKDPEVFPWRPVMREIAVPRLKVGERATLQCVISKYFPNALTIKWIKRMRSGHETQCLPPHYTVSESPSHRLEDHSYSCETCLSFTPSIAEEDGAEFFCRVQNPSLENPVSQSTGVLNVAAQNFEFNVMNPMNSITDMNTHWTGTTHSQPASSTCNDTELMEFTETKDIPKRDNGSNSSKIKNRKIRKSVEHNKSEKENGRDSSRQKKRKLEENDEPDIESHSEKKPRSNLEAHLLAAVGQEVDMDEASDGMGDQGEEETMISD